MNMPPFPPEAKILCANNFGHLKEGPWWVKVELKSRVMLTAEAYGNDLESALWATYTALTPHLVLLPKTIEVPALTNEITS